MPYTCASSFFFFNDTATTEIYTLSLHDALPIFWKFEKEPFLFEAALVIQVKGPDFPLRSEEHTSELQSHHDLVCRLLLEKKKKYASASARIRGLLPAYLHDALPKST